MSDPQIGQRFNWGNDQVSVIGVIRGVGEAIKFRRLRDGQMLQCGLAYFLRMAEPISENASGTGKQASEK